MGQCCWLTLDESTTYLLFLGAYLTFNPKSIVLARHGRGPRIVGHAWGRGSHTITGEGAGVASTVECFLNICRYSEHDVKRCHDRKMM